MQQMFAHLKERCCATTMLTSVKKVWICTIEEWIVVVLIKSALVVEGAAITVTKWAAWVCSSAKRHSSISGLVSFALLLSLFFYPLDLSAPFFSSPHKASWTQRPRRTTQKIRENRALSRDFNESRQIVDQFCRPFIMREWDISLETFSNRSRGVEGVFYKKSSIMSVYSISVYLLLKQMGQKITRLQA